MSKSKFAVVIILTLVANVSLRAQLSQEFGKVSKEEFDYLPEFEPDAPAVVLFDIGQTRFVDDEGWYKVQFTRTRRIKILTNEGLDFAEFKIPYYVDGYGKTESIESITGYTYNLDNWTITKDELQKSSVYEEEINNNWKQKVFAMPNVKVGSIVEIKYVLESPFYFNLPEWEFQSEIPTVYSKYQAKMIPFYTYQLLLQGASEFDEYDSKEDRGISRKWRTIEFSDMVYTYALKDVPSFDRDEAYISSANDYIIKLRFQLAKYYSPTGGNIDVISTWPKLTEELTDKSEFGKYVKKSQGIGKSLFETELLISGLDVDAKAQKIIEYVKSNLSWDGYYGKYARESPKEIIKRKEGSSAELNLLMIGMLQEAGIDAKPVIISTRNHGKVWKQYPFSSFFNYVIALVDTGSGLYLADATEPRLAHNRIPTRAINGQGLVVIDKQENWVDLYSSILATDQKFISMKIDPDQLSADVTVSNVLSEFQALNVRRQFDNDTSKISDEYLDNGFTEVKSVSTRDYEDPTKNYRISVNGSYPVESFGDQLVVKPFLYFPQSENKLKRAERAYDVDFIYRRKNLFNATIEIPEGYAASYLPETLNINDEMVQISYEARQLGNFISVSGIIDFKQPVYTAAQYKMLKKYMDEIVRQFNESIVFKKN